MPAEKKCFSALAVGL